ncbi:MAG: hypothetical protein EBZ13_02410 [Planctomycetia bacterium]|nr:hypothetical protein [Planctomycetia bacterium]
MARFFFADQVNWAKAGVDILPKESVFPAQPCLTAMIGRGIDADARWDHDEQNATPAKPPKQFRWPTHPLPGPASSASRPCNRL